MQELLDVAARESDSRIERTTDDFGFEWLDRPRRAVRGSRHDRPPRRVELAERGFGPQLLAAVFRFDGAKHPVYWIYGYKRGAFWPFVPIGERDRDNAEELELKAKMEKELPDRAGHLGVVRALRAPI